MSFNLNDIKSKTKKTIEKIFNHTPKKHKKNIMAHEEQPVIHIARKELIASSSKMPYTVTTVGMSGVDTSGKRASFHKDTKNSFKRHAPTDVHLLHPMTYIQSQSQKKMLNTFANTSIHAKDVEKKCAEGSQFYHDIQNRNQITNSTWLSAYTVTYDSDTNKDNPIKLQEKPRCTKCAVNYSTPKRKKNISRIKKNELVVPNDLRNDPTSLTPERLKKKIKLSNNNNKTDENDNIWSTRKDKKALKDYFERAYINESDFYHDNLFSDYENSEETHLTFCNDDDDYNNNEDTIAMEKDTFKIRDYYHLPSDDDENSVISQGMSFFSSNRVDNGGNASNVLQDSPSYASIAGQILKPM